MCKLIIFAGLLIYFSTQQGFGPKAGDIKYLLYNTTNPNVPIELDLDVNSAKYFINPEEPIRILAHGVNDDRNSFWYGPTKERDKKEISGPAYLTKVGGTVIFIDWSTYANGLYPIVALKTPEVGEDICEMIMQIAQSLNIALSRFHLIGHSLGAQVLGYAGMTIFRRTGQKIGRITGLDPAGPLYDLNFPYYRLSKDDAAFVDGIHTSWVQGYKETIGHADYWPNGGFVQKGCSLFSDCSHLRAGILFYESINSTDFAAWECGSFVDFEDGKCINNKKVVMGDNAESTYRGNFYLSTNAESPYAIPSY